MYSVCLYTQILQCVSEKLTKNNYYNNYLIIKILFCLKFHNKRSALREFKFFNNYVVFFSKILTMEWNDDIYIIEKCRHNLEDIKKISSYICMLKSYRREMGNAAL